MSNTGPVEIRQLKEYIEKGFGGPSTPLKYYSELIKKEVVIVKSERSPYKDLNSYCTIGLQEFQLQGSSGPMPFRVELLAGAAPEADIAPEVLVYTYAYFVNNNTCFAPGSVIPNPVEALSKNLPYLYISIPRYWRHDFSLLQTSAYDVRFLLVFPISRQEKSFCEKYGSDDLEALMEINEVDIFNYNRKSTL